MSVNTSDSSRGEMKQSLLDTKSKPRLPLGEVEKPKSSLFNFSFLANCDTKKWMIIFYAVGLLISSLGNAIFFRKMTNSMKNYPYFLSQLSTFVYVPIFFILVKTTSTITKEMEEFPKVKFFWMGVFDSVAGLLMLLGSVYTRGTTQTVLQQGVIPLTLACTVIWLRTKYHYLQYVGAFVIMLGVCVVMMPNFLGTKSQNGPPDSVLFNSLFFISNVPQALSAVYKETAFADADLDVNYLQYWVALWQFIFGFLLIPVNTLEFLGDLYIPWDQLPATLWNGSKCLFGVDTIVKDLAADPTNCLLNNDVWQDAWGTRPPPCDTCGGAWLPVSFYLVFNCFFNIFITLVIKHGSAALMFIVMTLKLPLTSLAFTMPMIMGTETEEFSVWDIVGLLVLVGGLAAYRVGGQKKAQDALLASPTQSNTEVVPVITFGQSEVRFVRVRRKLGARSPLAIRSTYYSRLGVSSPPPPARSPTAKAQV